MTKLAHSVSYQKQKTNPTTRILQDQSFSFSVTLRVPPSISGTESRIIKPLVTKRPGKKSEIKNQKKREKKWKKWKKNEKNEKNEDKKKEEEKMKC